MMWSRNYIHSEISFLWYQYLSFSNSDWSFVLLYIRSCLLNWLEVSKAISIISAQIPEVKLILKIKHISFKVKHSYLKEREIYIEYATVFVKNISIIIKMYHNYIKYIKLLIKPYSTDIITILKTINTMY